MQVGNPPDLSQFMRMNHRVNNILENLEQLHMTSDEDIPGTSTICGIHEEEQLKYYCRTCETPTCKLCRLQDHHKHECCPIAVIAKEMKKSLVRKLVTLREQKVELTDDISNFEMLKEVITKKNERVHGEITQHFESLQEILELQKQQFLDTADVLTNHKLGIIDRKLDNDRKTKDRVEKNIGDLEMTYKSMEYEKVLYTGKCVSANVENIPFANEQLSVDDDMKFLVSSTATEDFKTSLAKSHLVANDNVCLECCTTSLEPKHPKKGEKAVITVTCKDSNNCDIKYGGQKIKAEFTGYAAVNVHDEIDRNDGTHVFEFVPTTQGELIVKFCINGQEAPNCMLKTTVRRSKQQ